MDFGTFSISLAVKDIAASQSLYEKLGFEAVAGDSAQNWLILRDGDHTVGLFEGMFETNILTFNPGWDRNGRAAGEFVDIRDLQRRPKARGIQLASEADENSTAPASFAGIDPDGNPILVDQHV